MPSINAVGDERTKRALGVMSAAHFILMSERVKDGTILRIYIHEALLGSVVEIIAIDYREADANYGDQ